MYKIEIVFKGDNKEFFEKILETIMDILILFKISVEQSIVYEIKDEDAKE